MGAQVLTLGCRAVIALGLGDTAVRTQLSRVPLPSRCIAVAAGGAHTLAVTEDHVLWGWGRDEGEGRLGSAADEPGVGTSSPRALYMPALPPLEQRRWLLAAGGFFSLASPSAHTLWSCGGNANGECGRADSPWALGPVGPWFVAAAAVAGGLPSPDASSAVTAISAGGFHAGALFADGSLRTWGNSLSGALGHGGAGGRGTAARVPGLPQLRHFGCGATSTWAVGSDGSLWGWGKSVATWGRVGPDVRIPQRVPLPPGTRALAVSAGAAHSAVLCEVDDA
jgi:hypothetical protein